MSHLIKSYIHIAIKLTSSKLSHDALITKGDVSEIQHPFWLYNEFFPFLPWRYDAHFLWRELTPFWLPEPEPELAPSDDVLPPYISMIVSIVSIELIFPLDWSSDLASSTFELVRKTSELWMVSSTFDCKASGPLSNKRSDNCSSKLSRVDIGIFTAASLFLSNLILQLSLKIFHWCLRTCF